MKIFKKSFLVALGLGALLFGCKPDNVDPSTPKGNKDSGIAGVFDDLHPNLDTICKLADSIFFRSNDGSFVQNVCNDGAFFGPVIVPCVGPQPKWGSYTMYNGYQYTYDSLSGQSDSIHQLDVDFTLAAGVFVDVTNWVFTVNNTLIIDQNTGLPQIGTDWSQLLVDPMRNEWKIRVPIAELPGPCFDMACKMNTVQLSLFEGAIPGSEVTLWAINQQYNNQGSEQHSNSEYVVRYCPFACLEQTNNGPTNTSECVRLQTGYPGAATCTTLNATVSGATGYTWSTGATTPSISVCPTTNTTYTCSVTVGTRVSEIKKYDVKVENIRCGNLNQPQHKVWVCHIPPGNPNNPQDICIDWSGVPAHVARFRSPSFNIRQGHDSGCEIGHCGGNPCQQ